MPRKISMTTRFLHARISSGNAGSGSNQPSPVLREAAGFSARTVTFIGSVRTGASGSAIFGFLAIARVVFCYTQAVLLRETFPAGPFQCNCTVLACGDTKDAVIIDPGGEV